MRTKVEHFTTLKSDNGYGLTWNEVVREYLRNKYIVAILGSKASQKQPVSNQ